MGRVWVWVWVMLAPGMVRAQGGTCQLPPLSGASVPPNLFIVMDKSGSMGWRAAWKLDPDGDGPKQPGEYDPLYDYYGNFDIRYVYRYTGGHWVKDVWDSTRMVLDVSNPSRPRISGNILNWALMSRMDVLKRALTGGEGAPVGQLLKNQLFSRGSWGGYNCGSDTLTVGGKRYCFRRTGWGYWGYTNKNFTLYRRSGWWWSEIGHYSATVDVSSDPVATRIGIFRKLSDKDLDGLWDPGTPRWGVYAFASNPLRVIYEPFEVEFDPDIKRLYDAINGIYPGGGTGVADALLAAYHYLAWQRDNHWNSYNQGGGGGGTKDPWKDWSTGEPVPCRQSFVLVIGDGESNSDNYLVDSGHFPGYNTRDYDGDGFRGDTQTNWWGCCEDCDGCDDIADDYACYMNDCRGGGVDVRPDIDGIQHIQTYAIFTFGHLRGAQLFGDIATNGGGEFYYAQSGADVENAIRNALLSIISRAQSGTAAGVVSTGSKGEGTTALAFYFPRHPIRGGAVDWIGELRGFWIDPWGNLRADRGTKSVLELDVDPIMRMQPPSGGNIYPSVNFFQDTNMDGREDVFVGSSTIQDTSFQIWSAGWRLQNRDPGDRTIYANTTPGVPTLQSFEASNTALTGLLSGLWGVSLAEVQERVDYIRGRDQTPFRSRKLDSSWDDEEAWKLGDIVDATPTYVGKPAEAYHILYGDRTYATFFQTYQNRRGTFYVGANDGMLHAFNAGLYVSTPTAWPQAGELQSGGVPLGKELWALIPQSSLAGLKDYPTQDYCHSYYVDLKGKATDVRIFTPDATHPEGWGTILIQGMRLGCGASSRSSYLFLDVTTPHASTPQLLYEFSDPDLGFTTSYPAVGKVDTSWFAIFGSGPDSLNGDATSSKQAFLYVIQLDDALNGGAPSIWKFSLPSYLGIGSNRAYIGDPVTVDIDFNYNVDVIYFSVVEGDSSYLVRVNTNEDPNPSGWSFTRVMDLPRPQVAAVNVTRELQGDQVWVFGGTGRFFNLDQADMAATEYFYGILDPWTQTGGGPWVSLGGLLDVTSARTFVGTVTGDAQIQLGGTLFSPDSFLQRVRSQNGWVVQMRGEKVLYMPLVFAEVVYFTTFSMSRVSPCNPAGSSRLWALEAFLGAPTTEGSLGIGPGNESVAAVDIGSGMASAPTLHVGANSQSVVVQTGEGVIQVVREPGKRRATSGIGHVRPIPAQ